MFAQVFVKGCLPAYTSAKKCLCVYTSVCLCVSGCVREKHSLSSNESAVVAKIQAAALTV